MSQEQSKPPSSSNGVSGPAEHAEEEKSLGDRFKAYVAKHIPIEEEKPKQKVEKHNCEHCNQPLPTSTPYRGDAVPEGESSEPTTTLGMVRSKVAEAYAFMRENVPAPLAWMFRSLGWVLVGSVVAAAALGVSYFLVRYLVWYLLVALGKWLLEQIGKRLPIAGMGFDPSAATLTDDWMVGVGFGVGLILLGFLGKAVSRWYDEYKLMKPYQPGTQVVVQDYAGESGHAEAVVVGRSEYSSVMEGKKVPWLIVRVSNQSAHHYSMDRISLKGDDR